MFHLKRPDAAFIDVAERSPRFHFQLDGINSSTDATTVREFAHEIIAGDLLLDVRQGAHGM